MAATNIPSHDDFFEPMITSLRDLGGSGSTQEIYDKVCELEGFSEEQQNILHKDSSQSEISYRLAWARTYLRKYGLIENIGRGVWALTSEGKSIQSIDKKEINRQVRGTYNKNGNNQYRGDLQDDDLDTDSNSEEIIVDSEVWIENLLSVIQNIPPDAFERLCQRILRKSGFIKVDVTGRKGDGGIDGIGVLKIALLSFQVLFQCKRYTGSVGSSEIRDFRGSMVGRTDKGLLITTGTFTTAAKQEATRDGAPAIDLIDGEQICRILKDLSLGVQTKMVEVVEIQESWFKEL